MHPFEAGARAGNNSTLLETIAKEDAAKTKYSNKLFGSMGKLGISKDEAQSKASNSAANSPVAPSKVGKQNSILAGLSRGTVEDQDDPIAQYKKRVENAPLPAAPTYRGLVKTLSPVLDPRLVDARRKQRHQKFVEPERAKNPSFDMSDNLAFSMHMPADFDDPGLEETVMKLEEMQNAQATMQQPDAVQNALIGRVLADRPEWRQRMAVSCDFLLLYA